MSKVEEATLSESHMVDVIPLEDTPFSVVKFEDKYFVSIGKYRLTDVFESFEEAEEIVKNPDWFFWLSLIQAVNDENIDIKNNDVKNKTEDER